MNMGFILSTILLFRIIIDIVIIIIDDVFIHLLTLCTTKQRLKAWKKKLVSGPELQRLVD